MSFCLSVPSLVQGQGDFEPIANRTNHTPPSFFNHDSPAPIASVVAEESTPIAKASFTQKLYGSPVAQDAEPAFNHGPSQPQQDIVYSQEVDSLASATPSAGTWRERMRNQFQDAAANAPTSGMTASFFGGPGLRPSYFDGFGRTTGDQHYSGSLIGFSIGKRLDINTRHEIELSWRKREYGYSRYTSDLDLNTFAGMFNTYYDFDRGPGKLITPYLGSGLGASYEDVSRGTYLPDKTAFSVQLMTGVSINMSRQNELYFEARTFTRFFRDSGTFRTRASNDLVFGFRRTF